MLGLKQRPQILLALILIAWLFAGGREAAADTITIQLPGMDTALTYEAPSSDQLPTNLEPADDSYQVIHIGAATGCTSSDIEIVGVQGHPDNILEQWADPEKYGRYVLPDEEFIYILNRPVNARLLRDHPNAKAVFSAEVPRVNDQWVDCNDPTAKDAPTAIHKIEVGADDIRNFMVYPNQILIRHQERFYHGCRYGLVLPLFTVVNDSDQCFSGKGYPFTVAPNDHPHIAHETKNSYYDPDSGLVRSFEIKEPVQIAADEIWIRYKDQLGLRDWRDEMVLLEGYPQEATEGLQISRYEQQFKNVPVIGGNFLIHEQDGLVTRAMGQIIPDIDVPVKAELSKDEALQYALLAIEGQPVSEPTGRRVITSEGMTMEPGSWALAWRFEIRTKAPMDQRIVDVDARDPAGVIINNYSTAMPLLTDEQRLQLPVGGRSEACTLHTRTEGIQELQGIDIECGVYTIDGADYWFLANPTVPRFHVLEMRKAGDPPLYLHDNDSDGDFNGCDLTANEECLPDTIQYPEEIDGSSAYWAMIQTFAYVMYLTTPSEKLIRWWGEDPAGNKPVRVVITSDPEGLGKEKPYGKYVPASGSNPAAIYLQTKHPLSGYSAAKAQVTAHEFAHNLQWQSADFTNYTGEMVSVLEGLAFAHAALTDFYTHRFKTNYNGWCLKNHPDETGCRWNIPHPEESTFLPIYPTYQVALPQESLDTCADRGVKAEFCTEYASSMIAAHAFYLMSEGGAGENDLGCHYDVEPLDTTPETSRLKTGQIIYKTITELLHSSPNLHSLMIATMAAAYDLFPGTEDEQALGEPSAALETVIDAWKAVGIEPPDFDVYSEPYAGERDVYPWAMQINFEVPEGKETSPWEIQLAYDSKFTDGVVTKDAVLRNDGKPTLSGDMKYRVLVGADFELWQSERYYWRFREKSAEPWNDCYPIRFFDTGDVKTKIVGPDFPLTDDTHRVDFLNSGFGLYRVKGAEQYVLRVSTNPDSGCKDADDIGPGELVKVLKQKPDTIPAWRTEIKLLHPDTEYFWWIYAIGQDDEKGYCEPSEFATFKTKIGPAPVMLEPGLEPVSYQSPVRFAWAPPASDLYNAYRIRIWRQGHPEQEIYSKLYTVGELTTVPDGYVTLVDGVTSEVGTFCGSVRGFIQSNAYGPELDDIPHGLESGALCYNVSLPSIQFTSPPNGTIYDYIPNAINVQWKLGKYDPGYLLTITYHREASQIWYSDIDGTLVSNQSIPDNSTGWNLPDIKAGDRYTFTIKAVDHPDITASLTVKVSREAEAPAEEETTTTSQPTDSCPTLAAPTNLNPPLDGSYGTVYPGLLSWAPVSGATEYEVIVYQAATFSSPRTQIFIDSHVTTTAINPPNLYGYLFDWTVQAKNDCGNESATAQGTFKAY